MSKLRWGVLGTGNIVGKAGPAIQQSANGVWLGAAGRTVENSRAAADKYGVERVYSSYEELIEDRDIDAVYIALLNHLHYEWVMKAIEAGKHVLCEKPFTMNATEAIKIKTAAEKHGVQVSEAFVWRYQEAHRAAKEMLRDGTVGDAEMFVGHFSFQASETSTRLVREWGGGAIYDIGCYPISWSRYFLDGEPVSVDCRLVHDRESGVDMRAAATLYYSRGRSAQISCAFDMANGSFYELIGTKGRIKVNYHVTPAAVSLFVECGGKTREWTTDRIEPFRLQAEAFAQSILNGQPVPYGIEDAVANMSIIDALFEADLTQKRIAVGTLTLN